MSMQPLCGLGGGRKTGMPCSIIGIIAWCVLLCEGKTMSVAVCGTGTRKMTWSQL
jgi:hypothetical protein